MLSDLSGLWPGQTVMGSWPPACRWLMLIPFDLEFLTHTHTHTSMRREAVGVFGILVVDAQRGEPTRAQYLAPMMDNHGTLYYKPSSSNNPLLPSVEVEAFSKTMHPTWGRLKSEVDAMLRSGGV